MEAPDFWDDAEVSQQKMKELKSMKDDMEIYHSLETQMEDMETMIEMGYEENDPEIIPEIQEMLDEFQKNFDSIRVKTLLSGEYDSENAIIKLNAGAGGTEACDWCGMLYRMYSRWVDRKNDFYRTCSLIRLCNFCFDIFKIVKRKHSVILPHGQTSYST